MCSPFELLQRFVAHINSLGYKQTQHTSHSEALISGERRTFAFSIIFCVAVADSNHFTWENKWIFVVFGAVSQRPFCFSMGFILLFFFLRCWVYVYFRVSSLSSAFFSFFTKMPTDFFLFIYLQRQNAATAFRMPILIKWTRARCFVPFSHGHLSDSSMHS